MSKHKAEVPVLANKMEQLFRHPGNSSESDREAEKEREGEQTEKQLSRLQMAVHVLIEVAPLFGGFQVNPEETSHILGPRCTQDANPENCLNFAGPPHFGAN